MKRFRKSAIALVLAVLMALQGTEPIFVQAKEAIEDVQKNADFSRPEALTEEEALDMIYAEMYDLIVLDLNLPGVDGMEILRELRKEDEETKVLILSARSQIADKIEGLDAGANDYMEKPFHLQELEARIRSLTRRKFVQKDVKDSVGMQ